MSMLSTRHAHASVLFVAILSALHPLCTLAEPVEGERIVIDGEFTDWPPGRIACVDEHYLYLRVQVDRRMNLQGSDRRLLIWIDLDGSAETGHPWPRPGYSKAVGADLGIEFSPRPASRGVAVWKLDKGDNRTRISSGQAGLLHAPTYAATNFELRVLRRPAGFAARGAWNHVRGVVVMSGEGQGFRRILGMFHLPAQPPTTPRPADEPIPARGDDATSIVLQHQTHQPPQEPRSLRPHFPRT